MVEVVVDKARSGWAMVAATVSLVVAVGFVGVRQVVRTLLARTH